MLCFHLFFKSISVTEAPEDVIKIYKADQNCKFMFVNEDTTAGDAVDKAFQEFAITENIENYALYRVSVSFAKVYQMLTTELIFKLYWTESSTVFEGEVCEVSLRSSRQQLSVNMSNANGSSRESNPSRRICHVRAIPLGQCFLIRAKRPNLNNFVAVSTEPNVQFPTPPPQNQVKTKKKVITFFDTQISSQNQVKTKTRMVITSSDVQFSPQNQVASGPLGTPLKVLGFWEGLSPHPTDSCVEC